ncbi:MAG: TetR family transcriptional regulator [Microbacteriaceae bacterium]|nr:TetR family transcriptional regulator [Microbacteriaceae bacterium]
MITNTDTALESRTTPVQQRGHARVDALLDAAAELVEALGIAAMTTSAIAERSGSSVGVVYRYFPNADAVLVALAERNRDQFAARIASEILVEVPGTWQEFVTRCIDLYADMAKTVPAFRVVRFGDVVALRFANRESANNEQLGKDLDDLLAVHYGFARTESLAMATQVAMECADAVTRRAFLREREGDGRFIEAAKDLLICILEPQAPGAR